MNTNVVVTDRDETDRRAQRPGLDARINAHVLDRDGGKCRGCGAPATTVARLRADARTTDDLAASCSACATQPAAGGDDRGARDRDEQAERARVAEALLG